LAWEGLHIARWYECESTVTQTTFSGVIINLYVYAVFQQLQLTVVK